MIIHIGQRKNLYRLSCLAYKAYACEWNLGLSVERMNESVSYNLFGLPCLFQFSFNVMSISWHCMFLLETGRELNFRWSKNIIRSIAPHIFIYNFIINLIVLEYTCVCSFQIWILYAYYEVVIVQCSLIKMMSVSHNEMK